MPIYEYKCHEHGNFERIARMSETIYPCPVCGQVSHKVMSVFSANGLPNGHISRS